MPRAFSDVSVADASRRARSVEVAAASRSSEPGASAAPVRTVLTDVDEVAQLAGPNKRTVLGIKYGWDVVDLCQSGDLPTAWRLFSKLRDHQAVLHYNVYHSMLRGTFKAREPHRARIVYKAISADGHGVNHVTSCIYIRGLLQGSRRRIAGWMPAAMDAWSALKAQAVAQKRPLPQGVLTTGLMLLCRAGRMAEAEEVFAKLTAPTKQHYNMLVRGYGHAGNAQATIGVLEKMALRGLQPSSESFNAAVASMCQVGDAATAMALVDSAARQSTPVSEWAYSVLLQSHISAGEVSECEAVLGHMRAANVRQTAITFSQRLAMCKLLPNLSDSKAAAAQLWAELVSSGEPLSAECYNAMLNISLRGDRLCRLHALEAVQEMKAAGVPVRTDTFNVIMTASLANGDFLQAIEVFRDLEAEGVDPDAISYTLLMRSYQSVESFSTSETAFAQARAHDKANTVASNLLVDILVRARRLDDAADIVAELSASASSQDPNRPQAQELLPAFGTLATGYMRARNSNGAVSLLRTFNSLGGVPDERLYDVVLRACLACGEEGKARQVVRGMQLSGIPLDTDRYLRLIERALDGDDVGPPITSTKAIALERFKFWLGMPNEYYGYDDDQ